MGLHGRPETSVTTHWGMAARNARIVHPMNQKKCGIARIHLKATVSRQRFRSSSSVSSTRIGCGSTRGSMSPCADKAKRLDPAGAVPYAQGDDDSRLERLGLAQRAWRERRLEPGRRTARPAPNRDPRGSFFVLRMTLTTDIHTDLLTPLGAYLRLREGAAASFLLESVEKGRLGQASLVGSGARLVTFAEAEAAVAAGSPVVGYLGYDHIAVLEPTVPLPGRGRRPSGEPVRHRRHARPLRPRDGERRGARGRPGRGRGAARPAGRGSRCCRLGARRDDAVPEPRGLRGVGGRGEAPDRRGRRVPDRPLAARRAAHVGDAGRALPCAAPREPVALPLPSGARPRAGARRLLARDAGEARRAAARA